MSSRRRFVLTCGVILVGLMAKARLARALLVARRGRGGPHPEPRPGITAEKVLTNEELGSWVVAIPAFEAVRQIPQIADGIRCSCGCADTPGFRSLLSCYESQGMARSCEICQGEGLMAFRLFTDGKTLDEIRAAMDARFG